MSSWTIYSKDGVAKATVKELELHDEWMAESYLTISVKSSVPIDFAVDDYIDYRNERYAIQYDPTLLKKARSGSYGEGFSYDNIKFVNEAQAKIVRCDFNDIVLAPESESNKIHYSTLPTFPFYCETVDDLLDRILANLEDLYPGEFTIIGLNTVRNQERGELTHNDTYIEEYKKWIDPTMTPNTDPYGKIGVAEAVDNINCWNALAKVNEDFGLNFILRGYTIIVGTVGVFTANKFRYGKGNGLYEIERISDSEQQIITRLRAYGSNANLPSRYYANLNMECYGVALADGVGSTTVDIDFKKSLFKNEFNGSEVAVGLRIGSTEYPNSVAWINGVTGKTIINTRTNDPIAKDTKIYFISGINRDEWPVGSRDYATENLPDNMAISRLMLPGFPNKSLYDWVIDNGGTVVDEEKGIATINDFTGAFSKDKYRPYIDSPNTELYSIRPASIYFDGSNDTEDIHPTIEGMTYQGHAIDVITSAEQITDNGVYKEGETVPNFKITLPDLGFDLKEAWVENATINMKDGMCSARAFVIASQPKLLSNGKWECSCKREHDDTLDLWFPYNDFQIKAGDHYVLTGIDMPDAYVNAASERLFTAAIDALVKNHAPRFTFQPRIDELWMQRQHDQHLANPNVIVSLHDTLKSGDVFVFADDDLGIDASIIIDVLTIKENGNNGIATYEITLRDEKQVSPIQKIQNKVEVLSLGGVYGGTGGLSGRQVQSLIDTYGSDRFLSKVNDDEAQGILRFLQSLSVGSDLNVGGALDVRGTAYLRDATRIDGLLRALANIITNRIESEHYEGGWDNPFGSGFQINERSTDHVSFLSVDNLFVRMKAVFTELEIRKISYAGGNIIFSHAGSRIVSVQPIYDTCDVSFDGNTAVLDGSAEFTGDTLHVNAGGAFDGTTLKFSDASQKLVAYRCYLMKDDGTTATENWWRVDDQARCQTFNIDETGTYHNVSNSFYWRRVMGVGTELLEDGLNYDYVDLSVTDAIQGSTEPQAGDTIVQMGNRTDTERQGFISIQVAGEYAPSFEVYKGVNSYSLSGKRKICISPKYTEIRANRIIETTETGEYPMPHFRTEYWYTGMQCYYYDVVQHNGASWLCTYPEGGIGGVPYTTEEPRENATYWRVFAAEGKPGGTPLTVYAWSTSNTTAPAISGNAYPPAGWSTRITDRPTGGDYYLWMAETKMTPDGTIEAWGIPACISGPDGNPGEDAKNIEFIYKYNASGYDGNTGQVSPSGAASGSDTNKQQDDWVPNGWYDRALAVSESNPDVYMSSRKYNASTETWGAFGTPTLWGHYGSKGIDGDGVQYVYKLFDHELTDAERTSNIPTKPAEPNPQGEWIPTGWSDDPQAPTTSMPFCYCSIIKEINGTWGNFEKLGLWSKWAEDGKSPYFADIDNEMESVACYSSGKTKAAFDQTVGVNMWHGSTPIAFTISTSSVTGITITPNATAKTIRFQVAANTTLNEVSDITITLTASDGSGEVRTLHYVLNGIRDGKGDKGDDAILYSLVPSVTSIVRKKDGTYSVQNVSCTRQKNVGGTITDNTTDGTITYKIDGGSTEHSYTNNTNIPVIDFTKTIQFIFRVDSKVVDVETIPLVTDGMDGATAAVALCTPQMVSIPTDVNGKILNDFRQVVPISMSTNNEELSLYEVTILSGGANVELGPAILESHAGSKTTFSGNTAVIGDASFSGTTLVIEDDGSTLVPKTLIVKGSKNATLTEHICEIQVKGYDHEMNEYTAKTSLSIIRNAEGETGPTGRAGADGDDGVVVSLTPQSVILTQNTAGAMPTLTDAQTTISAKLGNVDVTTYASIVSATPSKYTVSGVTYNTCTCQISGKKVIITAIDQHGTETVSGQTINKYAEQGYIDIVVRYNGVNSTLRFNFYCNLLGTWKREVVGDAEYVAAQKAVYEMDDRGVPQKNTYDYNGVRTAAYQFDNWTKDTSGQSGTYQYINTHLQTAESDISTLKSTVGDANSGLVKNVNTLSRTATETKSEITQIKMGKNLLKGALSGSNFRCESTLPYPSHPPVYPTVDDAGWMNTTSGTTSICTSATITRGVDYVLSFYSKYTSAFNVTIWRAGSSTSEWSLLKTISIAAGSSSTRRSASFNISGDGSQVILICFPVSTLRYPQLEMGTSPTAFEVDNATETSSRITQTSEQITAKVNNTGVDITNGRIRLVGGKVEIEESVEVPTVLSMNDDMYTQIQAGGLEIRSKKSSSFGLFQLNSEGEIILTMYDKNGNCVVSLGGTPSAHINGEWKTLKLKAVDPSVVSGGLSEFTNNGDGASTYQLRLGKTTNSGSVLQYFTPSGLETTDSTVKGRDNCVFTSKTGTSYTNVSQENAAIAALSPISLGWYVLPNNGIFMQDIDGYYRVIIYQYNSSGRLIQTIEHKFTA